MKKYLMTLSVLVVTLLVVTGCGGKKLVCTGEENGMKVEITTNFKSDKVKDMTMKMTMEAPSEEEAKAAKPTLDSTLGATYGSIDGVTYSSDVKGKNLIMTIKIDTDKVDDETKEQLATSSSTYEDAKKSFEGQGYSCK